ncbi:MAG: peptidoglycan/LPS O-acetylase OafA/YrhL [Psychroserpens sp.]|jgi:peptidoglycan/LPS O-acetylase OafA/YrhL
MFKTIFIWLLCWSLLAFYFYSQRNDMAVLVLLCVGYIPFTVLLLTYNFQLPDYFKESMHQQGEKALWKNFKLHILSILVMTILLIATLHLPQESQGDRALKILLIFAITMFIAATALMSFGDVFISNKDSKNKK